MFDPRFGILPNNSGFNQKDWVKIAKKVEELEYSTILKADHLANNSYDPITLLATAAANTSKLKIGTAVFCVDYRHPAILAQTASTLQQQSNGRYEFGVGAGWYKPEYIMAGIIYDNPATRISRLDEALQIIKSLWTKEKTSFKGKYYEVKEMEKVGSLHEDELPKIMVGGGGKKLLTLAGKHADIVSIIMELSSDWPPKSIRNYSLDSVKEKIGWVKDSAVSCGRDPDLIEFALFSPGNVMISEYVDEYVKGKSKEFHISEADFLSSPSTWVGSGGDVCEKIRCICEDTGINYFQFQDMAQQSTMMEQLERFSAQIIRPMSRR